MTGDATSFTPRIERCSLVCIAAVTVVFAVLAYHRRWISDDGLIVVRTVRQLLDGNGPVFNAFERAEPNTSTLWPYLVAGVAAITRAEVAQLAVYLGLVLSVTSVALAMIATSRLSPRAVPAGVLVLIGVYPFWDFATSGLETGLVFAWLATCWWLLVTLTRRRLACSVFVYGLGPLVRPELAVVALVFFTAACVLERPSWRRAVGLAALALALPFAYEIFRAGYYGALVPLPALAKSAARATWSLGIAYARDFAHPYALWVPALALIGWALSSSFAISRRQLVLLATPLVAALLLACYVVRVGGDFMHARMLLAPTFLALLPVFALPLRTATVPVVAAIAMWAVVIAITRGDGKSHATVPPIEDERAGYVAWTGRRHPIDQARFVFADRPTSAHARNAVLLGWHRVLGWHVDLPMSAARPGPIVYVSGRLGTGGAVAPLDAIAADTLGLANPLGARITPTLIGYPGHEKPLPWAWVLADFASPAARLTGVPIVQIEAARHAMQCGQLKELLDSVRAPLTAGRFWANLVGALRRTRLEIPSDPAEAEHTFCRDTARAIAVLASTSWELDGWGRYQLVDGVRTPTSDAPGYTSTADAPQWIELGWATPQVISRVVLYPSGPGGFPVDLAIQIWNGRSWLDRATRTGIAGPITTPQTFAWAPADRTTRVRVLVTRLPSDPRPELKLVEIEALP